MASASVFPDSTSYRTPWITFRRFWFSVCSARMSRLCTKGRPELIIVANWRVNMTMSRVLTPVPKERERLVSFSRTDTGIIFCLCRIGHDLVFGLDLHLPGLDVAARGGPGAVDDT